MKNFSSFIRKLRVEREYSQDYVAMKLGVTLSAYSKIERGKTDPTLKRLAQLSEILEFKLEEFFTETNTEGAVNLEDKQYSVNQYVFVTRKEFQELNNQLIDLQKQIIDIVNNQAN